MIANFDPAPLFALSLLPYLVFLYFLGRSQRLPKLTLIGFQLTLLFVAVTIAAAIVASLRLRACGCGLASWGCRSLSHIE